MEKDKKEKDCMDCWHNYHCQMPQEGYDFNPDTYPYNPDNEEKQVRLYTLRAQPTVKGVKSKSRDFQPDIKTKKNDNNIRLLY